MATRHKDQTFGFAEFRAELEAGGYKPRPHETDSRKWIAHVPGRVDESPSLEFYEDDEGRVVASDVTGKCSFEEICAALGLGFHKSRRTPLALKLVDVLVPHALPYSWAKQGWRIAAVYTYFDETGKAICDHVRLERTNPKSGKREKTFLWRRITEDDKRIWGLKPCRTRDGREYTDVVRPGLYQLPELLAALKSQPNDPVYIVEGEKCADRLWAIGLIATCNPNGGGKGKWKAVHDQARRLLKDRIIYVLVDNDESGELWGEDVSKPLSVYANKQHGLRLVRLPGLGDGEDVWDWLESGGTRERLEEICAESERVEPVIGHDVPALADTDGLPTIVVDDRPAQHVAEDIQAAVVRLNEGQAIPRVCKRGGALHRIKHEPTPVLEMVDRAICSRLIMQACRPVRCTSKGELHHVSTVPFAENYILAAEDWPLPQVESIVHSPIPKHDGTLIRTRGYDVETQRVLSHDYDIEVPSDPARCDRRRALATIMRPFHQFPFADRESRRNLLGALMSAILRPLIEGCVPLFIIAATDAGTGKTLTWEVISILVTGDVAPIRTLPNTDAQMAATITAALLAGGPICFDNVDAAVGHSSLSAATTSPMWSQRLYGHNDRSVVVRNDAVIFLTGNNPEITGDLPRRCVWIRYDAKTYRPHTRQGFRIANLEQYARQHRAEILSAVYTLWRAWHIAGKPAPRKTPALGKFDSWRYVIGGILEHAGVYGLLGNAERMQDEADSESGEWYDFLRTWYAFENHREATVAELATMLRVDSEFFDSLPERIAASRDRGENSLQKTLGQALKKRAGKVHKDGFVIRAASKDSHTKRTRWCVAVMDGFPAPEGKPRELGKPNF